jgi:hypothetical protein
MINDILVLLRDKLNDYCRLKTGTLEDKVFFPDGTNLDPAQFPVNAVVLILVNYEEEKQIRNANRFEGVIRDNVKTGSSPAIYLNLMVLFVIRFSNYEQTMKFLSLIISFFQTNNLFDQYSAPDLPPNIDKIKLELQTMSFGERSELWNSLKAPYQPSVLYKVSTLAFEDEVSISLTSDVSELKNSLQSIQ